LPTILVADDNSNIQKMVTLAVKDMGVDVVGVGNGEAAVRKLSELKPDLILADIFMPVRSGYDVCEFVKHEASLAHIPVVLLAGAFDPFDEREAQRVGADGVLKKPFVPPDPLLSMIRMLLCRPPVPVGSGTAPAAQEPTAAPLPPVPPAVAVPPPAPPAREESVAQEEFAEEFAAPVPALSEEVAEKFGLRRDFSAPVESDDVEEPVSSAAGDDGFHSWRSEGGVDTSFVNEAGSGKSGDRYWERDAPALARHEESAILRDAEFVEGHEYVTAVAAPPTAVAAATTPVEETRTTTPFASAGGSQETATADVPGFVSTLAEQLAPPAEEEPAGPPALAPVVSATLASTTVQEPASKSYLEPATGLVPMVAVSLAPETTEDPGPPAVSDAAADNGSARPAARAKARSNSDSYIRDSVRKLGISAPPDPALVNAIVDAVIEKMRPQILDIVTREILRPVIEALVHREFDKSRES
jgi:CheY-like chemotaxis protein